MSWRREEANSPSERQRNQANSLRRRMTDPERRLWWHLRHRMPLDGTHWRRQVPLANYVVDFCCLECRLIVEVDGNQHGSDQNREADAAGTLVLKAQGFRVLRFGNREVMTSIDIVLDTILAAMDSAS